MNYVESLDLLGSEVKQIPNITGAGAPTTETEGAVGCQYMDTLTGDIYKCTAVEDGVCTWILTTVLATTLENNDTDKAPSVAAVNEGLAGKVNASGKGITLTTAYGRDANDNQIHIGVSKKASSKTANRTYVVPQFVSPTDTSGNYLDSKNPATVNVCLPEKDYNCVPKIYADGMHLSITMDEAFKLTVTLLNNDDEAISTQEIDLPLEEMIVSGKVSDDGEKIILTLKNGETIEFGVATLVGGLATKEELAEKQDKLPFGDMYKGIRAVYGRKANTGEIIEIAAVGYGNNVGHLVQYVSVNSEEKNNNKGTINVTQPRFSMQAANKQYVDDSIVPIKRDVANIQAAALGKLYVTQEYWVSTVSFDIPEGTLPHFYCGDITIYFNSWDGSETASAQAETITFYDSNGVVIKTESISQRYIEIPEGATNIGVDHMDIANKNGYPIDSVYTFGQMVLQVKVGA